MSFGGAEGGVHLGDRLSGLLDGELTSEEEASVRGHLSACAECRSELEAVETARAWVRGLPPVDPPFGFYERLLRRGPRPATRSATRRLQFGLAGLVAGAAAAVAIVGLGSTPDAPITPQVDRLVEAHATTGDLDDPVSQLVPVGLPVTSGR